MGLNLEQKQAVVAEVSEQVKRAQAIVLAEYRGLPVGNMTELRKRARTSGVYLRVLKNTLARRSVEGTQFAGLAEQMTGPLIYSISDDAVAAAKVINDFAKTNDKLVIKAGNYAGKQLDKAAVAALASIPSREVLISQLLGAASIRMLIVARSESAPCVTRKTNESLPRRRHSPHRPRTRLRPSRGAVAGEIRLARAGSATRRRLW